MAQELTFADQTTRCPLSRLSQVNLLWNRYREFSLITLLESGIDLTLELRMANTCRVGHAEIGDRIQVDKARIPIRVSATRRVPQLGLPDGRLTTVPSM